MERSANWEARLSMNACVIPAPAPCAKTITDFVSFGFNVRRDTLPMLSDIKSWDNLDFMNLKYESKKIKYDFKSSFGQGKTLPFNIKC